MSTIRFVQSKNDRRIFTLPARRIIIIITPLNRLKDDIGAAFDRNQSTEHQAGFETGGFTEDFGRAPKINRRVEHMGGQWHVRVVEVRRVRQKGPRERIIALVLDWIGSGGGTEKGDTEDVTLG